ncbi:MAG: hypothetical protein ACLPXB_09345 [Thiobacillaceae bacterium]
MISFSCCRCGFIAGFGLMFFVAFGAWASAAVAPVQPEAPLYQHLPVPSGERLDYLRFPAKGDRLLLWVSSEQGQAEAERAAARRLAQRGIEVWMLDLGFNYFLDVGRSGFDDIPTNDMVALLKAADQRKRLSVYVVGRAAIPLLKGYALWQPESGRPKTLKFILMHPNLYERAEALEDARYVDFGNLAGARLIILQPRRTTAVVWLERQAQALRQQGAEVKDVILERLREGFWEREDQSTDEAKKGGQLGELIGEQLGDGRP